MQQKTNQVIETGKILRKLTSYQQAWLENDIKLKVLEAREGAKMQNIAYSALNSSTSIVYDLVHVAYELDGIPFSKEMFINYVTKHHNATEDDAKWIANQINLPVEGASDFSEAVAASRLIPLPFFLADVRPVSYTHLTLPTIYSV